jgi:HEAT repeat protein
MTAMDRLGIYRVKRADIEKLRKDRNIRGLIRFLGDWDADIQWKAAETLGTLGPDATEPLLRVLREGSRTVRIGAIEALGEIRDPRAVKPLMQVLENDRHDETRFLAALALGEIGDEASLTLLVHTLKDRNKYVRYGAAAALDSLEWQAKSPRDEAYYLLAKQEWDNVRAIGEAATEPLLHTLDDPESQIRQHAVEILGTFRHPESRSAWSRAITDRDPSVRWRANLAYLQSGIPLLRFPMGLSRRIRMGKKPSIAALLNLLFLGLGYNYVGKWWGFLLFQVNLTLLMLFSLLIGPLIPQLVSYSISAVCGIHAYFIATRLHEMG